MMPTAPSTVERTVPITRMRFTDTPVASAKRGLLPTACIATPVFERANSHISTQQSAMKSNSPVGTVKPPILNSRKSLRICL